MNDEDRVEQIIKGIEAGTKAELAKVVLDAQDLRPEDIDEPLLKRLDMAVLSARCQVEQAKNGG